MGNFFYDIYSMTFYDRVKSLVKARGTTIEAVAESAKLSRNSYNSYRIKNHLPRADEAVAIAKTLRTTVEYLVEGGSQASAPFPDKVQEILSDLLRLDDYGLNSVATLAHGLAEQSAPKPPRTPAPRDPSLRGIKPPGIVPVRTLEDNEKQA